MKGRKIKGNIQDLKKNKECISDDLLYSYLEGRVTEAEAIAIQRHLNSCTTCFNEMTSLLRNSFSPATDTEKREIAKMRTITPQEQVSRILAYHEQLNDISAEISKREIKIKEIMESIKEFLEKWIYSKYSWKPALAALALIIFILGLYCGVQYYNTNYQILQAENILLVKHKIFIENTRLSGGYKSTGISILMAADDDKLSYLEQAKSRLIRAINKDSRSLKAIQLLAQIFIIEREDAKADSILTQMKKAATPSAALLNDLGVLYFQKREWKNAANNFQSARALDKNFLEAYYNLGLAKMKLHEPDEAISILNKYLELEDDEVWKDAAQHLISKINMINEEMN